MSPEGINKAEKAAREFLARVKDVRESEQGLEYSRCNLYGTKQTGALRRASMDLTRALANMRRA